MARMTNEEAQALLMAIYRQRVRGTRITMKEFGPKMTEFFRILEHQGRPEAEDYLDRELPKSITRNGRRR
jgi:hypothetical protein